MACVMWLHILIQGVTCPIARCRRTLPGNGVVVKSSNQRMQFVSLLIAVLATVAFGISRFFVIQLMQPESLVGQWLRPYALANKVLVIAMEVETYALPVAVVSMCVFQWCVHRAMKQAAGANSCASSGLVARADRAEPESEHGGDHEAK